MNKKRPIETHIHCLDIKNVWDEKRILKATMVGSRYRRVCMGLILSIYQSSEWSESLQEHR